MEEFSRQKLSAAKQDLERRIAALKKEQSGMLAINDNYKEIQIDIDRLEADLAQHEQELEGRDVVERKAEEQKQAAERRRVIEPMESNLSDLERQVSELEVAVAEQQQNLQWLIKTQAEIRTGDSQSLLDLMNFPEAMAKAEKEANRLRKELRALQAERDAVKLILKLTRVKKFVYIDQQNIQELLANRDLRDETRQELISLMESDQGSTARRLLELREQADAEEVDEEVLQEINRLQIILRKNGVDVNDIEAIRAAAESSSVEEEAPELEPVETEAEQFSREFTEQTNQLIKAARDLLQRMEGGYTEDLGNEFDALIDTYDNLDESLEGKDDVAELSELLGQADEILDEIDALVPDEEDENAETPEAPDDDIEEETVNEDLLAIIATVNEAIQAFADDPDAYLDNAELRQRYRLAVEKLDDIRDDLNDADRKLIDEENLDEIMRTFKEGVEQDESDREVSEPVKDDHEEDDNTPENEPRFPRLNRIWGNIRGFFRGLGRITSVDSLRAERKPKPVPPAPETEDPRQEIENELRSIEVEIDLGAEGPNFGDIDSRLDAVEQRMRDEVSDWQQGNLKRLLDELRGAKERLDVGPEAAAVLQIDRSLEDIEAELENGTDGMLYADLDDRLDLAERRIMGEVSDPENSPQYAKLQELRDRKAEMDREKLESEVLDEL